MKTDKITSPIKAIRAKCLDCCCGQRSEVKLCTVETCPLFPFRFGKNPYRKRREISDEQRERLAAQLRRAREKQHGNNQGEAEIRGDEG